MSFTSTIEQKSTNNGSILLSPSKRQKLGTEREPSLIEPTTAELWKWTFTHDAIASCFIHDVFKMVEHTAKEADFFWLGRVPCRTVRIVGLVVGVQVYEKRIRYTVDDGTSVIDCLHRPQPPPRTPVKKGQTKSNKLVLPPPPKPTAHVGTTVCVIGKVVRKYNTREISVDAITRCASRNDEPKHWQEVRALHKSSYDSSTPFQIPAPTTTHNNSTSLNHHLDSPSKTTEPPTPSTVFSTPASSVASSPVKSQTGRSPQKLRHPSRLHSRDLTGNTFRIYMKHYMDRASHTSSTHETDGESDADAHSGIPSTPTKLSRYATSDATPRPGSSRLVSLTPRPRIPTLSFAEHATPNPLSVNSDLIRRGFTLSYLRRVPDLADMAQRVVKAEAKRRMREERKKLKEGTANINQSRTKAPSVAPSHSHINTQEKLAPRMKRLFKWAIVQLLQEGSIVLWDGPVFPVLHASKGNMSGLWKANTTMNTTGGADSTVFSTLSEVSQPADEDGDMVISEPDESEEAYIILSPNYLAGYVEAAIKSINDIKGKGKGIGGRPPPATTVGRQGHTMEGATKETILAFLRKDDRWRCIGDWNVADALEVLRTERRAWCVGKGRWELSI